MAGVAVPAHGEQAGIVYLVTIGAIIIGVLDMIFTITFGLIAGMILLLYCLAIHIAQAAITHGPTPLALDAGIETAMPTDGSPGIQHHPM